MAIINANKEIERFMTLQDKIADSVTALAGTMNFVYIHSIWFGGWILLNLGIFGAGIAFDTYPFGLLTLIVSLEAIFLSTFVMISQNRLSQAAEVRSELDYQTDVKAEKEINIIMITLERLAKKQGVDVQDLMDQLEEVKKMPSPTLTGK